MPIFIIERNFDEGLKTVGGGYQVHDVALQPDGKRERPWPIPNSDAFD